MSAWMPDLIEKDEDVQSLIQFVLNLAPIFVSLFPPKT